MPNINKVEQMCWVGRFSPAKYPNHAVEWDMSNSSQRMTTRGIGYHIIFANCPCEAERIGLNNVQLVLSIQNTLCPPDPSFRFYLSYYIPTYIIARLHKAINMPLIIPGLTTKLSHSAGINNDDNEEGFARSLFYQELATEAISVLGGQRNWVSNTANLASLIYNKYKDESSFKTRSVNWVGFYTVDQSAVSSDQNKLVLGPFQGKVACTEIVVGKGVCGKSAEQKASVLVDDVHKFPGHIACDPASKSELVVPLLDPKGEHLLGVLDIDSTVHNGFDEIDRIGLEFVAKILVDSTDWAQP
ncbi:hypothetical protein H4219_006225 [Mycoemilia scoparia]|uniref:GAF domain-containing protein n=1 Tax=Mycoemilia scoparia TaxID=417184 RepID=A0A9W7ZJ32_9FUNG|nr:hypothetical protein H4219_006225 [Mycoemilia scoparia]